MKKEFNSYKEYIESEFPNYAGDDEEEGEVEK